MAEEQETLAPQLPLYLKQVRIRNYAPLLDATAGFQRGLNIIIGPNGVGKTRFLNIVSQLATPYIAPELGLDCELLLGYDADILARFQQPASTEKPIDLLAHNFASSELDDILEVAISYKGKNATGEDLDIALLQVGIDFFASPEPVFAKHGNPLQHLALVDVPATLTIRTSTSRTLLEPKLEPAPYAARPQLVNVLSNVFRFFFNRYHRYQQTSNLQHNFSANEAEIEIKRIIESYMDYLNPYVRKYSPISQIRLSNIYQSYDNVAQQEIIIKGLIFEYQLSESWLPFSALSDGTKRILYLITQMVMPTIRIEGLQAVPASFELEVPPRIIFLEEPELGIHHSQLHKLLQLILEVSQDSQIIMTTHAPQVLDILAADELDRITVCSLDPLKGTQFHKLSEEKQEQARTYMKEVGFLSDYWRYSYLEERETE